jgi:aspartate beta-hydroxylase
VTQTQKIDPYFFPALLNKGDLLERIGKSRQAAQVYRNALKIAPPADQLSPSLRAHAIRAKTVVDADAAARRTYLEGKIEDLRSKYAGEDLGPFNESVAIMAGAQKAFAHEPTGFHYPGLPATCFFSRGKFPWIAQLEEKTETILSELKDVSAHFRDQFEAYVRKPEGSPLNQWSELNNSKRWSALFLWKDGAPVDDICARAPQTAALLRALPMADIPGLAPSAFFSSLEPHTRIPPHTGVTNIRSIVHLPLIVPENSGFRVGNDRRPFRKGEAWVFDDTIEHEAWNDSDQQRVILIFDVWNPNLSAAERDLVRALSVADLDFDRG